MHSWNDIIGERLHKIANKRKCLAKVSVDPRQMIVSGASYLNWTSFNYLGLASHPLLVDSLATASQGYGVGSTGAPTLCGFSDEQEQLSIELAKWLGFEKSLLFTSGYQLAVGIFAQLVDKNTTIWLDRNCHASHIDGILLSRARFVTFTDDTINDAIEQIKAQDTRRHIIVTEGTFSMDGTCGYLPQIIQLKQELAENLLLIVDDAHGVGIFGENGFGTFEQLNLQHTHIDLFIGTLGKAFACHGGFVAGSALLIDYLQQTVRSLLFSTCLPAGIAAATRTSLEIISSAEGLKLRQQLSANIAYFSELSKGYNLPIYNPNLNISAIQLLIFNDEGTVKDLHKRLLEQNILCGSIMYPAVAKSQPRIRISLNAGHLPADIELLCHHLREFVPVQG